MTPAQLDEAIQALQSDDCHNNSVEDNEEPSGGSVPEENETLRAVAEEPQIEDGTPPDKDTITDDDDGAQSDSSEQSGLCIDYHSDSATEGTLKHRIVSNSLVHHINNFVCIVNYCYLCI